MTLSKANRDLQIGDPQRSRLESPGIHIFGPKEKNNLITSRFPKKSQTCLETMPCSEFFQFHTAIKFRGEAPEASKWMVGMDSCIVKLKDF